MVTPTPEEWAKIMDSLMVTPHSQGRVVPMDSYTDTMRWGEYDSPKDDLVPLVPLVPEVPEKQKGFDPIW